MTDRVTLSGKRIVGDLNKATVIEVPSPLENCLSTPAIEKEHVHAIYDTIAQHWSHTRYKAWPAVERFLRELPSRSLIADIGCGNAKNALVAQAVGHHVLLSDISQPLIKVCSEREPDLDVMVADCLQLPYRTGSFDASISIAVLHHLSSPARRIRAIQEAMRILRLGGRLLLYTWAKDQVKEGKAVSRHQFDAPDVLVKWHHKLPKVKKADWKEEDARALAHENAVGKACPEKESIIYERYCHVYEEEELRALFARVPQAHIENLTYDTGNWVVEAVRVDFPSCYARTSIAAEAGQ